VAEKPSTTRLRAARMTVTGDAILVQTDGAFPDPRPARFKKNCREQRMHDTGCKSLAKGFLAEEPEKLKNYGALIPQPLRRKTATLSGRS